jgi:hypothetical protein
LASDLRDNLGELARTLDSNGYHAEHWNPDARSEQAGPSPTHQPAGAETAHDQRRDGDGSGQQQQQQQQRRHQPQSFNYDEVADDVQSFRRALNVNFS